MKRTLQEFVKEVDHQVSVRCGMSIHDLPDIDFHNWWFDGIDGSDWDHAAHGAAEEALEEAGYPEEAL